MASLQVAREAVADYPLGDYFPHAFERLDARRPTGRAACGRAQQARFRKPETPRYALDRLLRVLYHLRTPPLSSTAIAIHRPERATSAAVIQIAGNAACANCAIDPRSSAPAT